MRAFLSHSSKDKGFVENVSLLLKPGTFEIDSQTFDAGLLNSQVIVEALKRCDLFCLFLSDDSINSTYVQFETLMGTELFAKGQINRFLVLCIDENSFARSSENIKLFSVVRRVPSIETAARLIQGTLVSAFSSDKKFSHPFIGREEALKDLEKQVFDPERPPQKAIYVSGISGSGRRTLVRKFFQDQYPQAGSIFPVIYVESLDGLEEIHRKVISALRPSMTGRELATRMQNFTVSSKKEKIRQISALLNSLPASRESCFIVDVGGVLNDSGAFFEEISSIIASLETRPHPAVSIISSRMAREKRREKDVAYTALRSLSRDESTRLTQRLLREENINTSPEQLIALSELCDSHPYNFYKLIDEVKTVGADSFLANPAEFVEWKHRRSSEYIGKIQLNEIEVSVLSVLRILPTLDLSAISDALEIAPEKIAEALQRLIYLHILEHSGDEFSVSPAVRNAVERDRRIGLPDDTRNAILSRLATSLAVRLDEGTAAIALVDSAVLSAIQSGHETFAAAFLLPSHYVWLARREYDQKHYQESIRLSKEALRSAGRLSRSAVITACRFLCLSSARVADNESFKLGILRLEAIPSDAQSSSNIAFLKGFNERMKGHQALAETLFREAYRLSPGNYSTARELSAIYLSRGDLDDAEMFAREAYSIASTNVYVLDILIAVLTRKLRGKAKDNREVQELMDALKIEGDEGGRSFYTTRLAELELVSGDRRAARTLAQGAISQTSNVFEPRRIYAEIQMQEQNYKEVKEVLEWMRNKVSANDTGERRTNYRPYLELYARYLTEMRHYDEAKDLYTDSAVFTKEDREKAIKEIDYIQMARRG